MCFPRSGTGGRDRVCIFEPIGSCFEAQGTGHKPEWHVLGLAYLHSKQTKRAIELLEYVVAVEERVLDQDDPERLASQHTLAQAYLDDKQTKRAIELLEHVDAARKKAIEKDYDSPDDVSNLTSVQSFDVPPSLTSGSTISDATLFAKSAAQEFTELLLKDDVMRPLFFAVIERAGLEKFKRNFSQLLYSKSMLLI